MKKNRRHLAGAGGTRLCTSKKIACYVRTSTTHQDTDMQKRDILDYLAARGWAGYEVFEDYGFTGTNTDRPEFKRMLQAIHERKIDTIVTWKIDRCFRSLKDLVNSLSDWHGAGVTFISLKDPGLDFTTASGRLLVQLLGCFGEFEAALIKERVITGLANARAKGKTLGRRPTIQPQQALALRQTGMSLSEIATQLGVTKGAVSKTLTKLAAQNIEIARVATHNALSEFGGKVSTGASRNTF